MDIQNFILEQALPIAILMSVIVWMWKYFTGKEKGYLETITDKDNKMSQLAEKALTVAALWDAKGDENKEQLREILQKISELKDIAMACKNKNS